jgi:hypothetical protein
MYNSQFFFVDNSLNRYTLSQRNKLKFNPDGSVDLYLQAANPDPEGSGATGLSNEVGWALPN